MSQPYIGEIRIFGGNFAPAGWAECDGRLLAISENDALFSLIGTTYGGDGQTTFGLPDLRGRLPVHQGTGPDGTTYLMGEMGGAEKVTLKRDELPGHEHALIASSDGADQASPINHVLARPNTVSPYIGRAPSAPMADGLVSTVGGGQPHDNVQPFQCLTFIIALFGIYPTQS